MAIVSATRPREINDDDLGIARFQPNDAHAEQSLIASYSRLALRDVQRRVAESETQRDDDKIRSA